MASKLVELADVKFQAWRLRRRDQVALGRMLLLGFAAGSPMHSKRGVVLAFRT